MSGIIEKVRSVVKDSPTYLSIDIDGDIALSPVQYIPEINLFNQSSIQA